MGIGDRMTILSRGFKRHGMFLLVCLLLLVPDMRTVYFTPSLSAWLLVGDDGEDVNLTCSLEQRCCRWPTHTGREMHGHCCEIGYSRIDCSVIVAELTHAISRFYSIELLLSEKYIIVIEK